MPTSSNTPDCGPQPSAPVVAANPVYITDVVLRDAHQSLLATRMRTEDMLPIAEKLNRAGYWSLEMWGGATFDSMMRFLNEDPWERVRVLKTAMPDTKLQMLLRGQNVVGYRNYSDDVLREFVRLASEAGIDVFRVFDALNDPRNMAEAIKAVKEHGKWVEGTISYTKSPVHNVPSFLAYAGQLVEMGAQSICIKDMAGLLDPNDAYELVSALKSTYPQVLVHMHSHYTSGMASMSYLKAVEAGADILDCAISSMSMGTSHPPTESIVAALARSDRATGMDIAVLEDISEYFKQVRKKYAAYESAFTAVDPAVLLWQIPGGMISNLSSQLKDQGALDRMPEVMQEVPRVRKELGYPPLVTPTSQIVGTQATLNVLMGRYKMVTKETRAYVQGFYGHSPAPIDPEVQQLIIGDETPITTRPADSLEPELPKRRAELEELGIKFSEEDLLSYALFPQVALEFFERRDRVARPRGELAALVATVADLLGVQDEACVTPVVQLATSADAGSRQNPDAGREAAGVEKLVAGTEPGAAWAAAGRHDLLAGRSVAWRY
jgi:pyruvate carboxylase subunit B